MAFKNITVGNLYLVQQAALMKLHIALEQTFKDQFQSFLDQFWVTATEYQRGEEQINDLNLYLLQPKINVLWQKLQQNWHDLFDYYVIEACDIVYSTFAFYHNHHFLKAYAQANLTESVTLTNVFENLTEKLYQAAFNRVYTDGLSLSQRIWKLDKESLDAIKKIIFEGAINHETLESISRKLKDYLVGENGEAGIYYKTMRLARTEIQTIYHQALVEVFKQIPFVNKVQIKLSPEHKVFDICDGVVHAGEKNDGIYEVGQIKLPLHPNCMCFFKPLLEGVPALAQRIRIFRNGKKLDISLTDYQNLLGGDLSVQISGDMFQRLVKWS